MRAPLSAEQRHLQSNVVMKASLSLSSRQTAWTSKHCCECTEESKTLNSKQIPPRSPIITPQRTSLQCSGFHLNEVITQKSQIPTPRNQHLEGENLSSKQTSSWSSPWPPLCATQSLTFHGRSLFRTSCPASSSTSAW